MHPKQTHTAKHDAVKRFLCLVDESLESLTGRKLCVSRVPPGLPETLIEQKLSLSVSGAPVGA
jgi:hypothetical protein